jgi:NitT/TauT family transport system permease protein
MTDQIDSDQIDSDQHNSVRIDSDGIDAATALGGEGSGAALGSALRRRPFARTQSVAAAVLPPLVMGLLIVGLWYFISYQMLDQAPRQNGFLLRPPHKVLEVGFLNWENFSEILDAMWATTKVAMIGLGISIALGIALAVVMSQSKLFERALYPYMVTLQAIPILAIAPLIGFWFGTATTGRLIVCVIISLFPIIVNTLFGLQSAERGMHDLFTLHRAGRMTRLVKLQFPAASPAIFAGLRIAAGLSVIGAIVGDFIFGRGEAGIGQALKKYANNLDGEQLLAAVIMSSVLGVSVFLVFGWIQTVAIGKWHGDST